MASRTSTANVSLRKDAGRARLSGQWQRTFSTALTTLIVRRVVTDLRDVPICSTCHGVRTSHRKIAVTVAAPPQKTNAVGFEAGFPRI